MLYNFYKFLKWIIVFFYASFIKKNTNLYLANKLANALLNFLFVYKYLYYKYELSYQLNW